MLSSINDSCLLRTLSFLEWDDLLALETLDRNWYTTLTGHGVNEEEKMHWDLQSTGYQTWKHQFKRFVQSPMASIRSSVLEEFQLFINANVSLVVKELSWEDLVFVKEVHGKALTPFHFAMIDQKELSDKVEKAIGILNAVHFVINFRTVCKNAITRYLTKGAAGRVIGFDLKY